jgi:hypothetical protein
MLPSGRSSSVAQPGRVADPHCLVLRSKTAARPEPNFAKMESAWAANRRRQRVALLTDRASMDKDERERGSVWPKLPEFQCRVFGDDPVAEPRCAAGGRSSSIIGRPDRPSSIVRPQPKSCPFRFGVVSLGPVYGWHPLSPLARAMSRTTRLPRRHISR